MPQDKPANPIAFEQEVDGRWIAEALDLPGCMTYGDTQDHAYARLIRLRQTALSLRKMECKHSESDDP